MTARRLARAAAIVALFGVLSRLLGFAREIILAAAFGASAATDAFVNSLLIVNSVAAILLYTLVTLVIPAFSAERAEHGTESAWRLMSALSAWVGALLIGLTGLALIWPEALASIYFLDSDREAETARLIRIMAPALLLQGLSALLTALLQIHGRFAGPAAVGVAFNAGIIAGVAAGWSTIGIAGAAWGVTAGATLQILLQLPQLAQIAREAGTRPRLLHPRLGSVAVLAIPVLLTSLVQQVNNYTDKLFASTLEAGRVTALAYANALGQAPRAAILLPLLTPLFPLIARLVAEGREGDAVQAFRRAAGLLAFVAVPITVLMAVYAQEVAQMAFGRGACDAACVDETASPLFWYAFAVWGGFASMLMNRTLAAGGRQREILWVTLVTVGVTIGLDLALLGPLQQGGLALATSIAVTANALMLLVLLRRRYPSLEVPPLGAQAARLVACGVVAAVVAVATEIVVPTRDLTSPRLFAIMAVKAVVVLLAYVVAARLLAPRELAEGRRSATSLVRRRG
jgi:putative peptidoglycan lipid II flippase